MELTRRMYATSLESIDHVERLVREEHNECSFTRCGHLEVACKPSHFDAYARSVEVIAREFGHELRIIPRNELGSEIGSGIYFGGIVDDTSAGLNPAQYVSGLARAALRAGASIHENARVLQIQRNSQNGSGGFSVHTSRGNFFAHTLLLATSGYTSAASPALQKKIIPIGSFIIATDRLPETMTRELSARNRMIFDSKHYLHYYRLTLDNRMLFGGRAAFFPETRTRFIAARKFCGETWLRSIRNCAMQRSNTPGAERSISALTPCRTPARATGFITRWAMPATA
jgi:glycine/D-amino acid oxidase-like deaminating enzyme